MEKAEVIELLETVPSVGSIWESQDGLIEWVWKQWPWEGTGYNSIYLMEGRVQNINLSIAFELTVEEVLDKYGFPEATFAAQAGIPEDPYVGSILFYPRRGIEFGARVLPDYAPILEPTSRVFEATYMIPAESLESWQESWDPGALKPWPGYGELESVFDAHSR